MVRAFFVAFVSLVALASPAICLLFAPPVHAAVPALAQPTWAELTTQQKQVLAPLAGEWDKFEPWRRKKWLGIAQRYPAMKPEEQERIQRRMRDWAKLTPDERKAVREQYKDVRKATPEQKEVLRQKWQEYKALPEDEKKRLKHEATNKPATKGAPRKSLAPLTRQVAPAAASPGTPPGQTTTPGAPPPSGVEASAPPPPSAAPEQSQ